MSTSNRPLRPILCLLATAAGLALTSAVVAQDAFHITFGTTGDQKHRFADTATFIAETEDGDLIVAGSGASFWSDDGQNDVRPMVARIDSRGELLWQRVYDDLANQRIVAFASRGEEQYMVLEPVLFRDLARTVTLRRIDARGDSSDVLGTLEGFWVLETIPVVDGELTYFLIAAKKGTTAREAYARDVQLVRLDLQGRITELSLAGGVRVLQHLQHQGGQEFLFSTRWHEGDHAVDDRPITGTHTDVMRLGRTGETEILLTMVGDGLCRHVLASRSRIVCAEFPALRTDQTNDAIVAYSLAGQELWRRNLERDANVQQIQLLGSEDLIYSYQQGGNTIVDRVDPSGGLVWSQSLRSTGQYTFLRAIEVLGDGRLAFVGSTGPFGGYTSTDTNAMLLVTGTADGDLNAPEIVSNVIGAP